LPGAGALREAYDIEGNESLEEAELGMVMNAMNPEHMISDEDMDYLWGYCRVPATNAVRCLLATHLR
jgi:hypothetical protein